RLLRTKGEFRIGPAPLRAARLALSQSPPARDAVLQLVRLRFGIGQTAKSLSLHDLSGAEPVPPPEKINRACRHAGSSRRRHIYAAPGRAHWKKALAGPRLGAGIPWDRLKLPSRFSRYR